MFEDNFEDDYKKAYDSVTPSENLVNDTIKKADAIKNASKKRFILKSATVGAAAVLCFIVAMPVCAANIPAFYKVLDLLSPALCDRLIPIEKSCSSQGITMEVEAVHVDENKAEIVVSVRDDEAGSEDPDLIHGKADLFDSYVLSDYANENIISGCSFLKYDEETNKAYFKIDVQSENPFRRDKLFFSVNEIICDLSRETRAIDLSNVSASAATKSVTLNGRGGNPDSQFLPDSLRFSSGTADDPRPGCSVLDFMEAADCAPDDFTITGTAYMDGVLRLQICMGDNSHSDRHVQPFLVSDDGTKRYEDYSVSWHENVQNASYQFYEYWFIGDFDNLADYSMYGIFHGSGNSISGDWEVTFRVE